MPRIIYITGVSGIGKSTIGRLLAKVLAIPFLEGDDYHPQENIAKMAAGNALNDTDRKPWLQKIKAAAAKSALKEGAVISCSALKNKYRELLEADFPVPVDWVHIQLSKDKIKERLQRRADHFMPPSLLDSQFAAFEKPQKGLIITNEGEPELVVQEIINRLPSSLGIIGLGVMGKSLCRNFAGKGAIISMYNREAPPMEIKVAEHFKSAYPELIHSKAFNELKAFVQSIQRPRRILLMVSAGKAIDELIKALHPLLEKGDCIIDAGNSHFKDTKRRIQYLQELELEYIGMGVSGGEKGALEGPAMMVGGSNAAFDLIQQDFQKIAAIDAKGQYCFGHVGKGSAGHFVKMVHNGIEYAEMQLIAELFAFLSPHLSRSSISDLLEEWNQGNNQSYLLEITAAILRKKEGKDFLLDKIVARAESKGTGNWTVRAAAIFGVPIPMINAAVTSRYFSMLDKSSATKALNNSDTKINIQEMLKDLEAAYFLARSINHQQGLHLIQAASDINNWEVNLNKVTQIWTNGCIIRSALMQEISQQKKLQPFLINTTLIEKKLAESVLGLQKINNHFVRQGIANPCFQAAWNYYLQFTQALPTAHLIQAQRDYFGAHTYRRIDKPVDQSFHTDWEA